MIPLYTFDHALFLALNFDGGPVMDRLMILVSGTAMWLPLYALILWLVWRREGWRRTLLFAAAIVLAIVLADMAAGIFKHSGPLKGLWADFPPRWRPMFTPALEGLEIAPDSLRKLRWLTPDSLAAAGVTHDWVVHVPVEAVSGRFGTVSAHAAVIVTLAEFSARYDAHKEDKTAPYPGILELLAALKVEGVQTAVFSNKADAFCGKIIEHYFGSDSFSLVRGSRPGVPTKPDPAGVYSLMADLGADPQSTLFVGDSDVDILTGHNAGLPALGVLWGFRGEAELTAAGADALAAKPEDILTYLHQH